MKYGHEIRRIQEKQKLYDFHCERIQLQVSGGDASI